MYIYIYIHTYVYIHIMLKSDGDSRGYGWWFRTKAKAIQDGFRTNRKPRRVPPPPFSISSQRPMTVASVSVSLGHTSTRPNRCTYPDATT